MFLVASVPGSHAGAAWGMRRAGRLLRDHCALGGAERWPVVAQASSLGSFGPNPQVPCLRFGLDDAVWNVCR